MFKPDKEEEKCIEEISRETKVTSLEIRRVIDSFYHESSNIIKKDEPASIRWPFLGVMFMGTQGQKMLNLGKLKDEVNNT